MENVISKKDWNRYRSTLNQFFTQGIGLQPITWLKFIDMPPMFGEDTSEEYTKVDIKGLIHYNSVKLWPYNNPGVSGSTNNVYFALYLSKDSLKNQGYVINNYLDLNPEKDRFIVNGKVYKPGGDMEVAQANDDPIYFFVILERIDREEAIRLFNKYKTT